MREAGWIRLAQLVKRERHRRGLSREAMAGYMGISESSLRKIEKAIYRPQDPGEMLFKVERGMHWQEGSTDRIARGLAPKPIPDPDMARIQAAWPDLSPEQRRMVADLAELQRP